MSNISRDLRVSIRSPHKSKGRPRITALAYADSVFQSAPLTKARGDTATPYRLDGGKMFQSAPLTKARGDRAFFCGDDHKRSFNPLPSQKQGETDGQPLACLVDPVSIRSPHKSKGRLVSGVSCCSMSWFQSAPLTKARGDRRAVHRDRHHPRFNPLPSQKQGETGSPAP